MHKHTLLHTHRRHNPVTLKAIGVSALGFFVVLALTSPTTVAAQSSPVTVDLSVLDDNGPAPVTGALPVLRRGNTQFNLIMPGRTSPRSMYYGPTISSALLNSTLNIPANIIESAHASASLLTTSDNVAAPDQAPDMAVVVEPVTITPISAPVKQAVKQAATGATDDTNNDTVALVPQSSSPPAAVTLSQSAPTSPVIATPPETEVAALNQDSPTELIAGSTVRVIYNKAEGDVPLASENNLSAIAEAIKANDSLRIQLLAYAGGNNQSSSKARRLSLSRALSVRAYFIGHGVRSTRIDVRALGNKTDESPINRIDINIIER